MKMDNKVETIGKIDKKEEINMMKENIKSVKKFNSAQNIANLVKNILTNK